MLFFCHAIECNANILVFAERPSCFTKECAEYIAFYADADDEETL